MSSRRKSEMWISNNRVLLGHSRKVHGRNPNFEPEETKLLISLWGDPKVQKTLITTHKKHPVIVKLAEKMREFGYIRSPEEINTRIKNLKCFYNRLKKDMEMGILNEPTWKHFNAMEEIMSRPIFSVRPDEVPKPSARYKMEEELKSAIESNERLIADNENEEEVHFKKEVDSDDDNDDEQTANTNEIDIEESNFNLVEPKQEPIDVDDDDVEICQTKTEESTETQSYIPVPTCNSPTTQGNQSGTMSGTTESECATALRSPPMRLATSQSSPSQGKISLVPANFLLKPPQPQIQLRPQQHILYAKPSMQNTSGLQTSGPGKMPMKVLLVNTVQKNHSAVSTTSATDTSIMSVASSSPMKTNVAICNKTTLPTKDNSAHQSESGTAITTSNRGFRTLLSNLIKLQTENIELTKKRIEMEKERFEFEKSMADKILNLLTPAVPQNKNTESEPSIPLLVPKVEKEDD